MTRPEKRGTFNPATTAPARFSVAGVSLFGDRDEEEADEEGWPGVLICASVTPAQFRDWFRGLVDGLNGQHPTEEQWALVRAKVDATSPGGAEDYAKSTLYGLSPLAQHAAMRNQAIAAADQMLGGKAA